MLRYYGVDKTEATLSRFSIAAALILLCALAACGEDSNTYNFAGVLTEQYRDDGSSEPFRLVFDVSLNKGKPKPKPKSVDCRVKNLLKPLWGGLQVGAKVKFTKHSTHKYREGTFCGLLNDAEVKDVLDDA
jgi:hypothetical protein